MPAGVLPSHARLVRAPQRITPIVSRFRLTGLLIFIVLALVACRGGSTEPTPVGSGETEPASDAVAGGSPPVASSDPAPAAVPDLESPAAVESLSGSGPVPDVDLSITDVELDDVVFDTFDGSFVPLSEASTGLVESLRDAIAPVYEPFYGGADALGWLEDDDLVLGYESGGRVYTYPLQILNLRELVNDTIDGVPVLVSYCPLCASAVVYDRRLGDRTLLFGNTSALYESDLVMFDHETGSYWFQVAGRAIVGELTGEALSVLPSTVASWGDWRALHPDALLLVGAGAESLGNLRYARDPFEGYEQIVDSGRFAFPVSDAVRDDRLRAAEVVVVVAAGGSEKAFPSSRLENGVNEVVGDVPVLVAPTLGGGLASAFDRRVGDQVLTFDQAGSELVDQETGTTWDRAGRAVAGALEGERLALLPLRRAFWFAVVAAQPGIALYDAG